MEPRRRHRHTPRDLMLLTSNHGGHMDATLKRNERATQVRSAGMVDTKLEVVIIPVSDVDRAKRFYGSLGWRLDGDFANDEGWRVVQLTPPGSPCSVLFGKGLTTA